MSKSVAYDTTITLSLTIKGRSNKSQNDKHSFMEDFYIKALDAMGKALLATNLGTVQKSMEMKIQNNKP